MPSKPLLIKRYPNRRYYARHASKYVTLEDIAELIRQGNKVEIRDSQTSENLTRSVLTQIIVEKHPEKMSLFPTAMLHSILQANDMMTDFLRDYFRDSLGYLEQIQRGGTHGPPSPPSAWGPWWWPSSGQSPETDGRDGDPKTREAEILARRVHELEEKVRRLEQPESSGEATES